MWKRRFGYNEGVNRDWQKRESDASTPEVLLGRAGETRVAVIFREFHKSGTTQRPCETLPYPASSYRL